MPAIKKKSKALTKVKVQPELLGPDPLLEIQTSVNKLKEEDSLKTAKELSEEVDCHYFRLGGVLSKIKENEWYSKDGFDSFKVFVQADLGMQIRKADYLVMMYNHLVEADIPYEKIKDIGWTKLRELMSVLNEDNVEEWVNKAKNMNTLQLIEEVKDSKKVDYDEEKDKTPNDIKSKNFKLHSDQREVIEEAIEVAKETIGSDFDAVALEHICLEFLGKPVGKKKTKPKAKAKAKGKEEGVTEEELDEVINEEINHGDGFDEDDDSEYEEVDF